MFKNKAVVIATTIIILLIDYKSSSFILRSAGEKSSFINNGMMNVGTQISQPLPDNIKLENLEEKYYFVALQKKGAPIFFLKKDRQFFTADVVDYVPKTASIKSEWYTIKRPTKNKYIKLPKNYQNIEFIAGEGKFNIEQWSGGKRIFDIRVLQNAILNLKTFYYPGWKLKLTDRNLKDKQPQTISPAKDGRIQLKLPEGNYRVEIYYRGTVAERIGLIVTAITICSLITILIIQNYFLKYLST